MKKIIITCPSCKKKMRINNKIARYKCPNCSYVFNYNMLNLVFENIILYPKLLFNKLVAFKNKVLKKYRDNVATYNYMMQVRKNMKRDPNWSHYAKQQKEEKEVNKKAKVKSFFKKFKK